MKIAILFDRFGPYHVARMRGAMAYADVLALEGAPHRAIYDWSAPELPKGMAYAALTEARGEEMDVGRLETRLEDAVRLFAPDTFAICGWSNMIALVALRWAHRRGIEAICMSETNSWDFERTWLKEKVKAGIVSHYSAGLVTSDGQAGYLTSLGIRPDSIFRGYNAIDNDFFRAEAARCRGEAGLPMEIAGQLPEGARGQYFLASSRFVEKKNLARLLEAYAMFRQGRRIDSEDWPLVLLGDGELRPALEAKIVELGLGAFVHLPGFLQLDSLPRFYATAGAFIHASTTEQWGLVVNEAMASGLPVAVSSRCGSAQFLIQDGVTGLTFDPFETRAIASALQKLSELEDREALLSAASAKVSELGPGRFGEGLIQAARAACAHPARPGFMDRAALDLSIARAAHSKRA